MSERTFELVEKALAEHVADENNGSLLTQWFIVACGVSTTDPMVSHYQYMNHDGAPHEWLGLLHMAIRRANGFNGVGEEL